MLEIVAEVESKGVVPATVMAGAVAAVVGSVDGVVVVGCVAGSSSVESVDK